MSRHNKYLRPVSCPLAIPNPVACWHGCTRVVLSIIFYDMHDYHKIRDVRSFHRLRPRLPKPLRSALVHRKAASSTRCNWEISTAFDRQHGDMSVSSNQAHPIFRALPLFGEWMGFRRFVIGDLGLHLVRLLKQNPGRNFLNVLRGFQQALGPSGPGRRSDCARCTSMRLWPTGLQQGCRPA